MLCILASLRLCPQGRCQVLAVCGGRTNSNPKWTPSELFGLHFAHVAQLCLNSEPCILLCRLQAGPLLHDVQRACVCQIFSRHGCFWGDSPSLIKALLLQVSRVHYPGLESHPDHAVAIEQMDAFGGVVSFEIDGDLWDTARFIDSVKLPYIAPSLGGCESLIEQPTVISYWDQGPEKRAEYGIRDNLVRFSCGVESLEDIWDDLEQALAAV